MKIPPPKFLSPFELFFIRFTTIDKIEVFYNERLQTWLYDNSHWKIKCVERNYPIFLTTHDENGNITNARYSRKTSDGIPLTQKDFIQRELWSLNKLTQAQLTLNQYKRVEFYREFLNEKMKRKGQTELIKEENLSNPFPEVFKTPEAYQLFERLHFNKKESPTLLADFSFIYRRMVKDELLQEHQKPEVFRLWLSKEPYKVLLDNKFKTLDNCTTQDKEEVYIAAKLLVQKQTK